MNSVLFENLLDQYMFGNMNIKEYRNEREKLVQELVFDPNNLEATPQIEVNFAKDQTQIRTNKPAFQVPTIKKQPSGISSSIWKVLLISLLIVTAIIAWYFSTTGKIEMGVKEKGALENNTEVIKHQSSIKDEPFILAFNKNNTWDTESISNFLVQWQSLSRAQQDLARQSDSFSDLKSVLQAKILQQRNTAKENNEPTSRKENLLIWFASQLSIGLN